MTKNSFSLSLFIIIASVVSTGMVVADASGEGENTCFPEEIELSQRWFRDDANAGTVIGLLHSLDPDVGDVVFFSMAVGSGNSDNAKFEIVGNALTAATTFNYALQRSFEVLVSATDLANHTTVTPLKLSLIPAAPNANLTERSTFITEPNYVNVLFEITDQNGRGIDFPRELLLSQTELFDVREEGNLVSPSETLLQIAKFEEVPYAMKTVILIDNSFGVQSQMAEIRQAARVPVEMMFPGQEIAIVSFASQINVDQGFTTDQSLLLAAIDGIEPSQSASNLNGAIQAALDQWDERFENDGVETGYLVVLAGRSDEVGVVSQSDVIDKRDRENKRIFTVGLGSEIDPSALTQIGNAGYWEVIMAADLSDAYTEIENSIEESANSFYWLNYASPKRGDAEHTLSVALTGNVNTSAGSVINAHFNSRTFISAPPGVAIDRSVYQPNGVKFVDLTDMEPQTVQAFTLLASDLPEYVWDINGPEVARIEIGKVDSSAAKIIPLTNGMSRLLVRDVANDLEIEIPLLVDVEALTGIAGPFSRHPTNKVVIDGQTAVLSGSVNENYGGVISWEFRANGDIWNLVENAHSPSLIFEAASQIDSGEYRLVFETESDQMYSDPAFLHVVSKPQELIRLNEELEVELELWKHEVITSAVDQSRDLKIWEPAGLSFLEDPGVLRAAILPEEAQLFFRTSYFDQSVQSGNGFGAMITGNRRIPFIGYHESGAMIGLLYSESEERLHGARITNSDGSEVSLFLDTIGLPTKMYINDQLILFGEFSGTTVDLAVIDELGNVELFTGVPFPTSSIIDSSIRLQGSGSAPDGSDYLRFLKKTRGILDVLSLASIGKNILKNTLLKSSDGIIGEWLKHFAPDQEFKTLLDIGLCAAGSVGDCAGVVVNSLILKEERRLRRETQYSQMEDIQEIQNVLNNDSLIPREIPQSILKASFFTILDNEVQPFELEANGSPSTPGETIVQYEWAVRRSDQPFANPIQSSGKSTTMLIDEPGNYVLTLAVVDQEGSRDEASRPIEIKRAPPTVSITASRSSITEDKEATLEARRAVLNISFSHELPEAQLVRIGVGGDARISTAPLSEILHDYQVISPDAAVTKDEIIVQVQKGQKMLDITIESIYNSPPELEEKAVFTLKESKGYTIQSASALVRITDPDEPALPVVGLVSIGENDDLFLRERVLTAGEEPDREIFGLQRLSGSEFLDAEITVTLSYSGTAKMGQDFVITPGRSDQLTLSTVPGVDDDHLRYIEVVYAEMEEPIENVIVRIEEVTNATIDPEARQLEYKITEGSDPPTVRSSEVKMMVNGRLISSQDACQFASDPSVDSVGGVLSTQGGRVGYDSCTAPFDPEYSDFHMNLVLAQFELSRPLSSKIDLLVVEFGRYSRSLFELSPEEIVSEAGRIFGLSSFQVITASGSFDSNDWRSSLSATAFADCSGFTVLLNGEIYSPYFDSKIDLTGTEIFVARRNTVQIRYDGWGINMFGRSTLRATSFAELKGKFSAVSRDDPQRSVAGQFIFDPDNLSQSADPQEVSVEFIPSDPNCWEQKIEIIDVILTDEP